MNTDVVLKSFIYDNGHYVYCPYSNKLLEITREHFSELKHLEYCGFEKYALLNKNCQSYKDIMFLIEKGITSIPLFSAASINLNIYFSGPPAIKYR